MTQSEPSPQDSSWTTVPNRKSTKTASMRNQNQHSLSSVKDSSLKSSTQDFTMDGSVSEKSSITNTIPEVHAFWNPNSIFRCPFEGCLYHYSAGTTNISLDEVELEMIASLSISQQNPKSAITNPIEALMHLQTAHHVEVRNHVHIMAYFDEYLEWWVGKIKADDCSIIRSDDNSHIILGHVLSIEDKELRTALLKQKLDKMLKLQQNERESESNSLHHCLFCKTAIVGRNPLFDHMFEVHAFNAGLPDNLVMITEFLSLLDGKLNTDFECIYCLKKFESGAILRIHQRKKKHFKIHSKNHTYDKFYIANYLDDSSRTWQQLEMDEADYILADDEEGFDDWLDDDDDDESKVQAKCLFDSLTFDSVVETSDHMRAAHKFDLYEIKKDLDFYSRIRMVNYIRHKTALNACINCPMEYATSADLLIHYETTAHSHKLPQRSAEFWTDANYLFPIIDEDPLLFEAGDQEFSDDEFDEEIRGALHGRNDEAHAKAFALRDSLLE